MLKGSRKQFIVVRTGSSRYFDEAYFVLRREQKAGKREQGDILREANRILQDSEPEVNRTPRVRRSLLFFAIGMLLGAMGAIVVFLLL